MLVKHRHPPLSVPRLRPSPSLDIAGQIQETQTSRRSFRSDFKLDSTKRGLNPSAETSSPSNPSPSSSTSSAAKSRSLSNSPRQGGWVGTIDSAQSRSSGNTAQLSAENRHNRTTATTTDGKYRLEVVQHPERTAELVGGAVLSRIPLSPPLVVQVLVEESSGNTPSLHTDMPFLTAHLWLYDQEGTEPVDLAEGPPSPGGSILPQRLLYGTLVSSLHHFKDLQGQPQMYFIFPDVSVRKQGSFRLMVTMMRLTSPTGNVAVMPEGERNATLASVLTDCFEVVSQTEYIAPNATPLTSSLHRQGARMY